jgi:hypothetical protein
VLGANVDSKVLVSGHARDLTVGMAQAHRAAGLKYCTGRSLAHGVATDYGTRRS